MDINDSIEILKNSKKLYLKEKIDSDILEDAISTALDFMKKQQKEIEELKNADLTIVYLNGVYDGEKKVEDKIKSKIEELDNNISHIWVSTNYDENLVTEKQKQIEVLQSLLERKKK